MTPPATPETWNLEAPPPVADVRRFERWLRRAQKIINGFVNNSGVVVADHNTLSGKQGGTTDEYYHLTATQETDLTDGGNTTLHEHTKYLLLAGGTMAGAIDMGNNDITGINEIKFNSGLANNDIYLGNTTSGYMYFRGSAGQQLAYWYFYRAAGQPNDNVTFSPWTNMYFRLYGQNTSGNADNGNIRLCAGSTLSDANDKLLTLENPVNTIKVYWDINGGFMPNGGIATLGKSGDEWDEVRAVKFYGDNAGFLEQSAVNVWNLQFNDATGGQLQFDDSGGTLTGTIGTNVAEFMHLEGKEGRYIQLISDDADNDTAEGLVVDTNNTFTTDGADILSLRTGGDDVHVMTFDGQMFSSAPDTPGTLTRMGRRVVVSRTSYQYAVGDFTENSKWEPLDISAHVPVNCVAVEIRLVISDATDSLYGAWRSNSGSETFNRVDQETQNGVPVHQQGIVPVHSQGVEYYKQTGLGTMNVCIQSYWI